MDRTLGVLLVAGAFALVGAPARAQNPNCSDNCGGGDMAGGNPYRPPPGRPPDAPPGQTDVQPPAPKVGAEKQAPRSGPTPAANPLERVANEMADAVGSILVPRDSTQDRRGDTRPGDRVSRGGSNGSATDGVHGTNGAHGTSGTYAVVSGTLPSAEAVRALCAGASAPAHAAARAQVLAALEGTVAPGAPTPPAQPAQQAAALELVRQLDGLLAPVRKPDRFFPRVSRATRAFNALVVAAPATYLAAPPAEFTLVHDVLEKMLARVRE